MSSIITVVSYENKFNKNVMVCKSLVESSIIVFIINYNVLHDSIFSAAYLHCSVQQSIIQLKYSSNVNCLLIN